jgi:hypothetical protein
MVSVAVAGVPAASVKRSNPAGVCRVRKRACGLVTTKECGSRRGRNATAPVPAACAWQPNLDTQFAVQHVEGLLVRVVPVHGTVVAAFALVFQDRQAAVCRVAAGADADQGAQEPDACCTSGVRIAAVLGVSNWF